MSSIPSAAASATSPLLSIHGHGHGHKKGVHSSDDATSDSAGSSGSTPVSTQGLFSSLLQSIERVVGLPAIVSSAVKPTPAAAASVSVAADTTAANSLGGVLNTRV